ncbi:MAG TPA: GspH/FimT family protein, partial [Methylibium sp.]
MMRRVPTSRRPAQAGFTLIELLTVLALLTVLLVLAAPSFVSMRRNSQRVTTANSFVASLDTARTDATKRGISTYVIPLSGQDWTSGWLIYADNDRSQTFTTGDAEIYRQPAMPEGITADNSGGRGNRGFLVGRERYVSFNGSGYPRT